MSHKQQIDFCKSVQKRLPHYFEKGVVLDVGSLDINGNNKSLFSKNVSYFGIDLFLGANVDKQVHVCDFKTKTVFDVVISTEALEHDVRWKESLVAMYSLLKKNGLLIITCAGKNRKEHGTHLHHPNSSPGTLDYYQNISVDSLKKELTPFVFSVCSFSENKVSCDTYFWGVKK